MDTTTETTAADLKTCFANLEDPRDGHAQVHELLDMIIIAICASIYGADCWTEVEAFGKAKACVVKHVSGVARRHPLA